MDYITKPEPAVLRLAFAIPSPLENGSFYIDISQVTSLVNRKFMPQGLNWACAGITAITGSSTTGTITTEKLPNTWILANSWVKSHATWERMNESALEESESVRPKFLDFKIYADAQHHQLGYAANLLPYNSTAQASPGEWQASKIIVPKTDGTDGANNFEVIATGPNYPGGGASSLNAVSMIEGYAASRGLPNVLDPNTPDDANDASGATPENWMVAVFNEGTTQDDAVLSDMISENNLAPYPFENDGIFTDTMYPGGANQLPGMELHDLTIVSGTTVSSRNRIPGGNFPCGLIKVTSAGITGSWNLFVDLVPGPMRGYLCEPMSEMN